MIDFLKTQTELNSFFTDVLLENQIGVVIDKSIPKDKYLAIDTDEFYHKRWLQLGLAKIPEIADRLLILKCKNQDEGFIICIFEMKNISSPKKFKVENIYNKFYTVIEDFMKNRYSNAFLDNNKRVKDFRLLFISDAYKLKKRGFTNEQIKSFLNDTKIANLQNLPLFCFRSFKTKIEYELPNPIISN